jgi:hypothetical protein
MWYVMSKTGRHVSRHRKQECARKAANDLRFRSGIMGLQVVYKGEKPGQVGNHEPVDERLQAIRDTEAVRVVCIEVRNMLEHIREKVPKSPHGCGPDGWLSNVLSHLDMIIEATVKRESTP